MRRNRDSIRPIYKKDEWAKMSTAKRQELENQIQDSYQIGLYVALGLFNKKELFDESLIYLDPTTKDVIISLIYMSKTNYQNFIKGVMNHWYSHEEIWREDIFILIAENQVCRR